MYPTPQFCVCSEFSFSSQKWEGGGRGRGGKHEAAKIIESGRGGEGRDSQDIFPSLRRITNDPL